MLSFSLWFVFFFAFFWETQAWHHIESREALETSLAEHDTSLVACKFAVALTLLDRALTSLLLLTVVAVHDPSFS